MNRFAVVALLGLLAVAQSLPNGFIFAMVPRSQSYRADIYRVDPATGSSQIVGDYLQFDFKNYPNSGTYNPATKKVYFLGDTMTARPTPNPIGNFMVSLTEDALDWGQRLYQYSGWLYNVRSDASGNMFGVEEDRDNKNFIAVDTVGDDGAVDLLVQLPFNSFIHNAVALDPISNHFFVAAQNKSQPASLSLMTVDLRSQKILGRASLPSAPIALCFDDATNALYGLFSSGSDSVVARVDPVSGQASQVAVVKGQAKLADCRGGSFFAVGGNTLTTVDLATGRANSMTLSIRPDLIVFFAK